jgi:uncharacterized membrane protein YwaF
MHTLLVIGGGLVLLAVMVLAGRLFEQPAAALRFFLVLWLIATVVNLWVGVTRAGYTVMQELPIGVVVFGVPALVALALLWRLRG